MKELKEKLKADVKQYGKAVLAVGIALAVLLLITGEVCPIRRLWGIPCPGCGISRAGMLLLEGKLKEAFRMHAFVYVIPVLLAGGFTERYFFDSSCSFIKKAVYIIAGLAILYYGYRMIVYFPNQEPMIFYNDSVLGKLLNLN